jgi:uncharacterized protein YgiM (DUF1202 family)
VLDKGTAVAVLDKSLDGWYKIAYEGKIGYVSADYMILDRDNRFTTYGRVNGDAVNVRAKATTDSKVNATLTQGTLVTVSGFVDGWYNITSKHGTTGYIRSDFLDLTESDTETVVKTTTVAEPTTPVPASENGGSIADFAKQYLGVRYVWGGASAKGFDCSGFTMYVYKQFGYSLPHTASGQWASGLGSKLNTVNAQGVTQAAVYADTALQAVAVAMQVPRSMAGLADNSEATAKVTTAKYYNKIASEQDIIAQVIQREYLDTYVLPDLGIPKGSIQIYFNNPDPDAQLKKAQLLQIITALDPTDPEYLLSVEEQAEIWGKHPKAGEYDSDKFQDMLMQRVARHIAEIQGTPAPGTEEAPQ